VPGSVGASATHLGAESDVAVKEAGVVAFNQLRIEVQAMRQDVGDVMDRLAVLGNLTQTVQYQAMHPDHQTQRSRESQFHFKSALIKYYEAGYCKSARHFVRADDPEQATYIQCAVTGWKLKRNKCIAGHVLPHASAHLAHAFGLSPEGINDVRNGLLCCEHVEELMHPPLRICFLYDILHDNWKFTVLDGQLLVTKIRETNKTFGQCNGKTLKLPDGKSPWKRLLWIHAEQAITAALSAELLSDKKWEEERGRIQSLLTLVFTQRDSDAAVRKWRDGHVHVSSGSEHPN